MSSSMNLKDSTVAMMENCGKNVVSYTVAEIVENEYGAVYSGHFQLFEAIQRKYKKLLQKQEAFDKMERLSIL